MTPLTTAQSVKLSLAYWPVTPADTADWCLSTSGSQWGNALISLLLSTLFPPSPGRIDGRIEGFEDYDEQGWAGNVREKPYRDAIDRHWKTRDENRSDF